MLDSQRLLYNNVNQFTVTKYNNRHNVNCNIIYMFFLFLFFISFLWQSHNSVNIHDNGRLCSTWEGAIIFLMRYNIIWSARWTWSCVDRLHGSIMVLLLFDFVVVLLLFLFVFFVLFFETHYILEGAHHHKFKFEVPKTT